MITRIYIDNYRCFTNFEFAPQRINLLLGANGSGKSALFEVLAGVVDVVVNSAEVGEGVSSEYSDSLGSPNVSTSRDGRSFGRIYLSSYARPGPARKSGGDS